MPATAIREVGSLNKSVFSFCVLARSCFVWQVSLLKECDHPNVIRQCDRFSCLQKCDSARQVTRLEGFMRCCPWTELCTWCLSMWIWPGPQGHSAGKRAKFQSLQRLECWTKDLRIFLKRTQLQGSTSSRDGFNSTYPSSTAH